MVQNAAQTTDTNNEMIDEEMGGAAGHAPPFMAHNATTASDLTYHG
jgi:hypothetical protein